MFGEGSTRGIMFISDGPGEHEEESGQPFTGESGRLLRKAIKNLGIPDSYMTYTVSCRSCQQAHNGQGEPMFYRDKATRLTVPRMRDETPLPVHTAACLARLHEEIYLVDPVVIVTLGAEVAKLLTHNKVSVTVHSGTPEEIEIPGAWARPALTDKKGVWGRKIKGTFGYPVVTNPVRYLIVPTLHPSYVMRKIADKAHGNAFDTFIRDLKAAVAIYNEYQLEVHGIVVEDKPIVSDDFIREENLDDGEEI